MARPRHRDEVQSSRPLGATRRVLPDRPAALSPGISAAVGDKHLDRALDAGGLNRLPHYAKSLVPKTLTSAHRFPSESTARGRRKQEKALLHASGPEVQPDLPALRGIRTWVDADVYR